LTATDELIFCGFVYQGARHPSKIYQSDLHLNLHFLHPKATFSHFFWVFVYCGAWHRNNDQEFLEVKDSTAAKRPNLHGCLCTEPSPKYNTDRLGDLAYAPLLLL